MVKSKSENIKFLTINIVVFTIINLISFFIKGIYSGLFMFSLIIGIFPLILFHIVYNINKLFIKSNNKIIWITYLIAIPIGALIGWIVYGIIVFSNFGGAGW